LGKLKENGEPNDPAKPETIFCLLHLHLWTPGQDRDQGSFVWQPDVAQTSIFLIWLCEESVALDVGVSSLHDFHCLFTVLLSEEVLLLRLERT